MEVIMLKKVLVLLMTAVMLISCVSCFGGGDKETDRPADPTPAPTPVKTGDPLVDNLFFNADFSKGVIDDATGNSTATQNLGETGTLEFIDDEEAGKVVNLKTSWITYDVDLEKMGKTFTMETYVKTKRQTAFGVICGTYWDADKAGVSFITGMFPDPNKPFGSLTGLSTVVGSMMAKRSVEMGKFREWNHLVYVHDGENGKDYFYLNGVPVEGYEEGVATSVKTMKHSASVGGFNIGAYNAIGQFSCEDLSLSFVRMYDFAADSATVTKLYEACPTATTAAE